MVWTRPIAFLGASILIAVAAPAGAQQQDGGVMGRIEAKLDAIESQLKRIQRPAFYAQIEGLCSGSCGDAATKKCVEWGYVKGEATVIREGDRFFHIVCHD